MKVCSMESLSVAGGFGSNQYEVLSLDSSSARAIAILKFDYEHHRLQSQKNHRILQNLLQLRDLSQWWCSVYDLSLWIWNSSSSSSLIRGQCFRSFVLQSQNSTISLDGRTKYSLDPVLYLEKPGGIIALLDEAWFYDINSIGSGIWCKRYRIYDEQSYDELLKEASLASTKGFGEIYGVNCSMTHEDLIVFHGEKWSKTETHGFKQGKR
ncbi:hypothetical protein HYC85_031530 [Camellia sinensis]|uniref:Uncharacterized protein n=1 Tax=Camellia sinensis TaxID=4442 RepID=A0A7J7FRH2_CAMSI|nr:hypothetical protein HYC85_031530 [Camellia sinensis]